MDPARYPAKAVDARRCSHGGQALLQLLADVTGNELLSAASMFGLYPALGPKKRELPYANDQIYQHPRLQEADLRPHGWRMVRRSKQTTDCTAKYGRSSFHRYISLHARAASRLRSLSITTPLDY